MYAIISVQGQQFRVEPGTVITTNRIAAEPGETMALEDCVLLAHDGTTLTTGTPTVAKAGVELEILEHLRGKKVTVFKMKRRKRYRRKQGHRQELTRVRVKEIALGKAPAKAKAKAKAEEQAVAQAADVTTDPETAE